MESLPAIARAPDRSFFSNPDAAGAGVATITLLASIGFASGADPEGSGRAARSSRHSRAARWHKSRAFQSASRGRWRAS